MLIGYARVSTLDQNPALQLDALHAAGISRIYQEQGSAVGPRPALRRALRAIRAGDSLIVWKLDRLARSLPDLLAILDRLGRHGAGLRSLTEPIDTTTPLGLFLIEILGAVAELERNIIRERTRAGVAAARARGAVLGRPRALTDEARADLLAHYQTGSYVVQQLADMFGCSYSTVYRAVHPLRQEKNPAGLPGFRFKIAPF